MFLPSKFILGVHDRSAISGSLHGAETNVYDTTAGWLAVCVCATCARTARSKAVQHTPS